MVLLQWFLKIATLASSTVSSQHVWTLNHVTEHLSMKVISIWMLAKLVQVQCKWMTLIQTCLFRIPIILNLKLFPLICPQYFTNSYLELLLFQAMFHCPWGFEILELQLYFYKQHLIAFPASFALDYWILQLARNLKMQAVIIPTQGSC